MESRNIFCWKCGKKLADNSVFCSFCGTKLDDKEEKTRETMYRKTFGLRDVYYFCHKHKKIIYAFIVTSIILHIFFMPWKREFTNQGKKTIYEDDQYGYGTIFYQPEKFADGYSPQDYGLNKYYGSYVSYDYKRIMIHEIGLLVLFTIGYKVYFSTK